MKTIAYVLTFERYACRPDNIILFIIVQQIGIPQMMSCKLITLVEVIFGTNVGASSRRSSCSIHFGFISQEMLNMSIATCGWIPHLPLLLHVAKTAELGGHHCQNTQACFVETRAK